jgi:hypothetical protein
MSKIICDKEEIIAIADAIRAKSGTTDAMALTEMDDQVAGMTGGGISAGEVVNIVKDNFDGGIGYEESGVTFLVPEQTITLADEVWVAPSEISLIADTTYTVNFNGTIYECMAIENQFDGMDLVYVGNGGLVGLEASTANEPFILYSLQGGSALLAPEETEIVFSVSGYATVAHKIAPKFLDVVGKAGIGLNAEVFNGGTALRASGMYSHAEGFVTESSGACSHSEGEVTVAKGDASHAEGRDTIANGNRSHAEGDGTVAYGDEQHAQGRYNIKDVEMNYAHIVGNGITNSSRSNAHTLDWGGNAWFAGKVKVGGTSYDDPDAIELGNNGISVDETVQTVKTNFDGGIGYEENGEVFLVPEQIVMTDESTSYAVFAGVPTAGVTYTVRFGNNLYECVGKTTTFNDSSFIYIGNLAVAGELLGSVEDTGEPFLFGGSHEGDLAGTSMLLSLDMINQEVAFSVSYNGDVVHGVETKFTREYIGTIIFTPAFLSKTSSSGKDRYKLHTSVSQQVDRILEKVIASERFPFVRFFDPTGQHGLEWRQSAHIQAFPPSDTVLTTSVPRDTMDENGSDTIILTKQYLDGSSGLGMLFENYPVAMEIYVI